jgi:hypothetical protein
MSHIFVNREQDLRHLKDMSSLLIREDTFTQDMCYNFLVVNKGTYS